VFPGDLLPSTYPHADNPERIIGRSEVERRSNYIQLLHGQLGEQHPLVQLVHQCLQNAPARRPSAEELLRQLEAVRAQTEGPYGSQLVKVDVVKVGMVKVLKEKDAEIERLQQQLQVCKYSVASGSDIILTLLCDDILMVVVYRISRCQYQQMPVI